MTIIFYVSEFHTELTNNRMILKISFQNEIVMFEIENMKLLESE